MFGSLGGGEILLILIVALLLFGPRKLPQIGKTLGKAVGEFRNATNELRRGIEREVHLEELKETGRELTDADRRIRNELRAVTTAGTCEEQPAPVAAERPAPQAAETGHGSASREG